MGSTLLSEAKWFQDDAALGRGEPGIRHAYLASLATVLDHVDGTVDPVRLMGSSAFAFRIWVSPVFCPSATSVFDWRLLLPEAVEQYGYRCRHIVRMWEEDAQADARRREAHETIIANLELGRPVVCWDVYDHEWGVITGYSETGKFYHTLDSTGAARELPEERLGRNGIDILSVIAIEKRNTRLADDITRRALRAAVNHAAQKEPLDRPDYEDGLSAYDLWATMCDRWAKIDEAGRSDKLSPEVPVFARYCAEHIYSARCYAREYLRRLAQFDGVLADAADHYAKVAEFLAPVLRYFTNDSSTIDAEGLRDVANAIRGAAAAEKCGIAEIRFYLGRDRAL